MNNLLFARWGLPNIDKKLVLEAISVIPENHWFYEPYRNTTMLPLSTKAGRVGYDGTSNYNSGDFIWTDFTPAVVREWCEDVLFPALTMRTRIVILKTPAGAANHEHIDCDPPHQFTQQHKFRVVLQGETDTLYFIKKSGNIPAPKVDGPFIMDGSWPHGMINNGSDVKYTLTAGAPWNGLPHYDNLDVLMWRDNGELPHDYQRYYKQT